MTELGQAIERMEQLKESIDIGYLCICAAFVLLMQVGFAFLEGGCLRYKDMQSIMIKIFMNTCVTIVIWWVVGYGIAFGSDSKEFVGSSVYVGFDMKHSKHLGEFAFQTAVASAATSIVSGGAAGRMTYIGYFILSVVFSSVIYPFCAHWGFGHGWLMELGYHDYAGSGTIHASAGMGALMTTMILKPRNQRFNPKYAEHFEPNNPIYITLACLSLWVCWCFFNGGSSLGIANGASVFMSRAIMNTFIAGASGALTVFFIFYLMNIDQTNRYSLVMICNGNLAGLVAITGPCDNVDAWAAFVIGILGGIMMVFANRVLFNLQIDDPVDAISIHFACGMLGANLVSWFDMDTGIVYGKGGYQFAVQMLGSFIYIGWSALIHLITLLFIEKIGFLRVTLEEENEGLDIATTGSCAYEMVELQS
ncbi:unnamed protein product [Paramecium sonneborni]|uniref:Ammonium transporter AmtB-like domain-containing protein n=1 Tax=Paramecium sonneborni TaxID=65129 RepID=A0A8S1RLI4_9CILI|nr:unnamed protein product [Paramecium sonneborni]